LLTERFGVSERHACLVVGQPRSTQRLDPPVPSEDEEHLRAFLRNFSVGRPRWGWRRAADAAREAGWRGNNKRIHRLWRDEGLRVPYRKRKKPLRGTGLLVGAMCPIRPNVVWALDFQFDQTADGRALKLLNIVDEFTRESLVMMVERSIDAETVVTTLERLCGERGAPELLRMDNGPEMTAHALRDWCLLAKTGTVFIEPGSPWQNPFVESFHSRVRDELLDVEEFCSLAEARVVIGDWREDYNQRRPHSALGMLTPATFAADWTAREPTPIAA
jgi:putative transposase